MPRNIDYSALTDPVTKDEVAAYRAEAKAKANGSSWAQGAPFRILLVIGVCVIVAVVVIPIITTAITLLGLIFGNLTGFGKGTVDWGSLGFIIAIGAVLVSAVIVGIRRLPKILGRAERIMRLDRFAQANALLYTPQTPNPNYPGMIFGQGHSRFAREHFRSTSGRFLDFGSYRYEVGHGRDSTTHHWGFLALALDRRLPHMMLDAKSNNGFFGSNLPAALRKDQVLSLEGDFDKHFTLYCPREYERDALYVFTPDLMALLIDESSAFDVEIVDNWMFVYSARPFDVAKVEVLDRLFRIVDTVGAKTLSQTERYRDERVAAAVPFTAATPGNAADAAIDPGTVAPQGRRLKRGVPKFAFVAVVGVAAFMLLRSLGGSGLHLPFL